jgi:uncharacterized protein YtpQ (UPF0354 family)
MPIDRRGILGMGLLSFLIGVWKPAQAKAATFRDMAEFRRYIMAILTDRNLAESLVADPTDSAQFKMTAHGETSTVNLTNIFGYVQAEPGDSAPEVERFIRSITYDHNKPVEEGDIVAVVRTQDYAREMAPEFLREPLGADLVIVYMADEPDAMKTLSAKDVAGKNLADVRGIALNNLRKWLPKVDANNELGDGVLYGVDGNELLSTSLILLDDFWKAVADRFPGDVLIALPTKDQLFLFDDKPQVRAGVRRLIDATIQDSQNVLSPRLYARRGGKIVAVAG